MTLCRERYVGGNVLLGSHFDYPSWEGVFSVRFVQIRLPLREGNQEWDNFRLVGGLKDMKCRQRTRGEKIPGLSRDFASACSMFFLHRTRNLLLGQLGTFVEYSRCNPFLPIGQGLRPLRRSQTLVPCLDYPPGQAVQALMVPFSGSPSLIIFPSCSLG